MYFLRDFIWSDASRWWMFFLISEHIKFHCFYSLQDFNNILKGSSFQGERYFVYFLSNHDVGNKRQNSYTAEDPKKNLAREFFINHILLHRSKNEKEIFHAVKVVTNTSETLLQHNKFQISLTKQLFYFYRLPLEVSSEQHYLKQWLSLINKPESMVHFRNTQYAYFRI